MLVAIIHGHSRRPKGEKPKTNRVKYLFWVDMLDRNYLSICNLNILQLFLQKKSPMEEQPGVNNSRYLIFTTSVVGDATVARLFLHSRTQFCDRPETLSIFCVDIDLFFYT